LATFRRRQHDLQEILEQETLRSSIALLTCKLYLEI
jgi:hypothetical protein